MAEVFHSNLLENYDTLCQKCRGIHSSEMCLIQNIEYYIDKYANQVTF